MPGIASAPFASFIVTLNAQAGGQLPTTIRLLPAGRIKGRDGREFLNDRPDAIIAAFNAHGVDLPIDLEHATELKAPSGEPAPAVGWIKSLINVDGAIDAGVEWTDEGARLLSSKAYRYLSPAFLTARDDPLNRVQRFSSAALTNKPNLEIPALNAQSKPETTMDKLLLTTTLGLNAQATDHDIVTALNALKAKAETPDPAKFVLKADLEAALNRANALQKQIDDGAKANNEQKAKDLVDQAVKDGKVAPASKDHYLKMCSAEGGLATVEELFKTLPKLTSVSNLDDKNPNDKPAATSLNSAQRDAAKLLGVSEEDYAKTLAEEKAATAAA